ncbi:MAG: hypothetical protein JWQ08_1978 [Deinococcus sp.]|nr:hypothetical protein [Deinococcus sp.]
MFRSGVVQIAEQSQDGSRGHATAKQLLRAEANDHECGRIFRLC